MEFLETSDSEGMSAVADSESDVDDNLYTNRLMCAENLSLSPSSKALLCAIECSPVIEPVPYRRLTELEKTVLISGKKNASGSTSISSGSPVEVLVCGDEGCSNLQQGKGHTEAAHNTGLNEDARNGIMEKAGPEELCPGGEQKPVSPGATRRVGCRAAVRGSQGAGGSRAEGMDQGACRSAGSRSLRSRGSSEIENPSKAPSAQSRVSLSSKPAPELKPLISHPVHTRSGCFPSWSEDSVQQDRKSSQSPPQPFRCGKPTHGPTYTCSDVGRSPCSSAKRNCGHVSGQVELKSRQSSRRPRPGRMEKNTQRKKSAPPESMVSMSEVCPENQRKGKYPLRSCTQAEATQAESEECRRTLNSKRKAAPRPGGRRVFLCSIIRRNLWGETGLHRAVMDGDVQLMRRILQLGVDVNVADYAGWTPLHEAALRGFCEMAAALLEAGATVNCIGDEGITPLHDAVGYGHYQVAQLFLDHGADPLLKNKKGQTALNMTDDSFLRKMIERYLPMGKGTPLAAQRSCDRTSIQEGSKRQQVMYMMQEESATQSCGSTEAARSSFINMDESGAEQGVRAKPSALMTSPSLCLRRRSVILPAVPDNPEIGPKGQSVLPAEEQSQGCTEDSIIPSEDMFERSSVDKAPDCETQEMLQNSNGKEMPAMMVKPKGIKRGGKTNDNALTKSSGQSPVKQSITSQSPMAQKTASQSPFAQSTISQSPVTQSPMSQSSVALKSRSPFIQSRRSQSPVAQSTKSQSPFVQSTMSQFPVTQSTIRQSPVAQKITSQSPFGQSTVSQPPVSQSSTSQSPVAQKTASQSPFARRITSQSPVTQRTASQSLVPQKITSQSPFAQSTMSQLPVTQSSASQSPVAQKTTSQSLVTLSTASKSPVAQKTASEFPFAQNTINQSPVTQDTTSQSPVAKRTMSQYHVAQRRRRTKSRKGRNDSHLDLSALSSMLCDAGSGELSVVRQEERDTEKDFESTDVTATLPLQPGSDWDENPITPKDRKSAAPCHCFQQDVPTEANTNLGNNNFSLGKVRSEFLDYYLETQMPESHTVLCHVRNLFEETGDQCWVENTQEQQDDLHSRDSDLAGSMMAKNKTGTKGPLTVGCETELQKNTVSQSLLAALPEGDTQRYKGTTSDLILGTNGDLVINVKTSDLLQNIHRIQRNSRHENSVVSTVGQEIPVLPLKAPGFRDIDLSANTSGDSEFVNLSPGEFESSEECSISLLAPHSDVQRWMNLPSHGDGEDKMQPDTSTEEPTLTLESDSSTPSLLIENLNMSKEFLPTGLHVVSSVREDHEHGTSSKAIDLESNTPSSNILMQKYPPDSHVSLPCSMVEDHSDLHRVKSRAVTEPVQIIGASGQVPTELPAVLGSCHSEHQEESVQNHTVAEPLHVVKQVSCLTEIDGITHSTLGSEKTDRTRGRFLEVGCSLMTCNQANSPCMSGNGVLGRETEGRHTEKILKVAPETPGLRWEEQLLKNNLLCNSASINFSSETQENSTIQESQKTSVTKCYMQETESRNGKEKLLPKSNEITSLSTSNSKDMELACSMRESFDIDVHKVTVGEDVAQAEDSTTNSSYDSNCTMISGCNYLDSYGADSENVCQNLDPTSDFSKSQVRDNAKRSFESAFGISKETGTENHYGDVTSSEKQSAVDSSLKLSNVGKNLDVKHQNKDFNNFSGEHGQNYKARKTKNTRSDTKEEEHKIELNVSWKKQPAGSASVCPAVTPCTGPLQTLKLPIRNINKRNCRGESQLHMASKKGDLALVRALIEAGMNVNQADYAGWTPLHEASARGHTAVVQELLLSGADVNSRGLEGLTSLHDAVQSNHYEAVKLLLQYGSNPHDQNVFGKSALDLECNESIKELLSTFHGPFLSPGEGSSKSSSGKLTEACSQIQDVLNNVLNKHKAENRELTRKYRTASDSFKQGILRQQLMSLASRQKCLLRILQKQNSLKLSVQTQSCRLLSSRSSTQCLMAGENQPGMGQVQGINTGYNRTKDQEPPLSGHSIEAPFSSCSVAAHLSLQSAEAPFSSQGVVAPLSCQDAFFEEKAGDAVTLHDSSDSTHITSDTESVESEPDADALGSCSEVTAPCENTPRADNVLYLESARPETRLVSTTSAHQSPLCSSSQQTNGARSDQKRSESTSKNVHLSPQVGLLLSNNTAYIVSSSLTNEHNTSQTHLIRPSVTPLAPSSSHHQTVNSGQTPGWSTAQQTAFNVNETLVTIRQFGAGTGDNLPGGLFPHKPPVSVQGQRNSSGIHSRNSASTCQIPDKTTSGSALVPGVQTSVCEATVRNTLPQRRDRSVSNRQLISLIQCGVIKPGDLVLHMTVKGCTYRASLLPDGSIKDMKDHLFLSPEEWVMSLLGPNMPVTSAFAWKKVTYRSKSLLMYLESSDLTASQAFFPVVTHRTEAGRTSVSNFMDINKILLISHDEFMPSRLMDHYWNAFSQSDEWEI